MSAVLRKAIPAAALSVIAALALAGCLGDDADSPLDNALGYLPEDAPLVITVGTGPNNTQVKSALGIVEKFPFGKEFVDGFRESVTNDANFENDIAPILGNDAVLGAQSSDALSGDDYLVAIEVKDTDKAEALVKKGSEDVGDAEGATVYQDDDTFSALHDDVLLLSNSKDNIGEAIKQRDEDDRFTEDKFDDAFEQLPKDSLASVYVDIKELLAQSDDPDAKQALKIKWVNAIESLGLTGTVQQDSIDVGISLNTNADELSPTDLPFATGAQAPQVLERAADSPEIALGIRDPAASLRFALEAAKQVNPAGEAEFEQALAQIGSSTGVDVQKDIAAQFSGDTSAIIELGGDFAFRSAVEDANSLEQSLSKLVEGSPRLAQALGIGKVGRSSPKDGGELFALSTEGGRRVTFGVVKGVFIAGNEAGLVADAAARKATSVPGASGAIAVSGDGAELAKAIIGEGGGLEDQIGGELFTAPLGELNGSLQTSPDGLRGGVKLEIE